MSDISFKHSHTHLALPSAVDKLDKETWENVRKEMIEVKGLDAESADKIGEFVKIKGNTWEVCVYVCVCKHCFFV